MVAIKLPDGSILEMESGVNGFDIANKISPNLAKAALAITVDGKTQDLSTPITTDATVTIITGKDKEGLHILRHSCSHVMAQAVKGGRCMTAYNKKWHIKDKQIVDYDAVSLYPSAMSRLYTVEGKPEVIEYSAQNLSSIPPELSKYSAFIIEIKITKVGKHYPFPLIVQKTEEGNLNKDTEIDEEHPLTLIVDNIYLEDLINFQLITFDVIRGYGWTGKKDYRIQKVIKNIFNKRLEYKKTNNPLQQLYKLIMNS